MDVTKNMMNARILALPTSVALRVRCRTTPEQDRMMYLSGRRAWEAQLAREWHGQVTSVYHPITLPDGSYWRSGRWNKPSRHELVTDRIVKDSMGAMGESWRVCSRCGAWYPPESMCMNHELR